MALDLHNLLADYATAMPVQVALVVLCATLLLFVFRLHRRSQKLKPMTATAARDLSKATAEKESSNGKLLDLDADPSNGFPTTPHLQGCFFPFDGRFLQSNHSESEGVYSPFDGTTVVTSQIAEDDNGYAYENDLCTGRGIFLHRATHDSALDRSGKYPFGDVFKGRRINWEMRVQFKFKSDPTESLQFGIELDEYVPLMRSTQYVMGATVQALKWVVGNDLYHSTGQDPAATEGEAERPIFAMPLWAFDQVIETPEGEEPPRLGDPNFSKYGVKREDAGRRAFAKTMADLNLRAGPTYTFSFWSISQFLDNVMWQIRGVVPGLSVDFNQFCGRPPVHVVLYSNKPSETGDERHLRSRRNTYFHLAFWSSLRKPSRERLETLMSVSPSCNDSSKAIAAVASRPRTVPTGKHQGGQQGFLGCFTGVLAPVCGGRPSRQAKTPPAPKDHPTLLKSDSKRVVEIQKTGEKSIGARRLLKEMIQQS